MGFKKDIEEFEIPLDNLVGQSKFDPVSDILQTNLDDRRIVINDSINDYLMERVELWILQFNKEDKYLPVEKRKKIYIYINSPGGDMVEGAQLLSVIECSKTPIVTVGFGMCASMAFYLLMAGHERLCFKNTIGLRHDGCYTIQNSSRKATDQQKFYEKIDQHMIEFELAHSKMDEAFLDTIADREYYMFPEEMRTRGIIDKVIGKDIDLEEIL